ncbi:heavy-metal-associated domain-containing protein [Patulibacter defluvii]|uniref:heavy-metal-associated domain-containing protein n=1 Tax=Patulibacter defluvii TaxID=3095358 RepID=UPI002A74D498|nr:cation transporter [Patulibacter sp. DM4]
MSTTEQTFTVQGMTCGHCELSVREEVLEVEGVVAAEASHRDGRLVVQGTAGADAIRRAVETAGYRVAA